MKLQYLTRIRLGIISKFYFYTNRLIESGLQTYIMTYGQLIERIADEREISKTRAKMMLEGLFDTLAKSLSEGKGVSIPEIGTFKTKTRESRIIYSPHHNKKMIAPPKRVVDFTPSSRLKENLKFVEPGDE